MYTYGNSLEIWVLTVGLTWATLNSLFIVNGDNLIEDSI